MFSRTALLLLLLAIPRCDPSNFSAQTGRSLLLDPGVSPSVCFSAQSRGRDIPDPGLFLSLFNTQEIADSLCDLSKCYMLSICLLGILKLLCRHNIMYVSRLGKGLYFKCVQTIYCRQGKQYASSSPSWTSQCQSPAKFPTYKVSNLATVQQIQYESVYTGSH